MLIDQISSFLQVVLVDLVLAGDNVIVISMVATTVATDQRHRVILIGIMMAAIMRIGFALVTVQLLEQVAGLLFAGGLLLLWVAWKLWQGLRADTKVGTNHQTRRPQSIGRAIFQIALADLSMSLDNVLAVAGIARHHPVILVFGIALSIALMAISTTFVARVLDRHRWIAYVGLGVILYVALTMILTGIADLKPYLPLS